MKVGTRCGGRIKQAPRLPRRGCVAGWRADKAELKERKAFKTLPAKEQARIEAEKLEELRETMSDIFE